MFWPFTVWINCSSDLKFFANSRPSAYNFKKFSRSLEQFFLTVGQNNFGDKIPFLSSVKNKRVLLQNFVAFSEYMNLILSECMKMYCLTSRWGETHATWFILVENWHKNAFFEIFLVLLALFSSISSAFLLPSLPTKVVYPLTKICIKYRKHWKHYLSFETSRYYLNFLQIC